MPDQKKILIIDDEREFAENVIKPYLEQIGNYRICVETMGSRGHATAQAFGPDLIFLDVMMRDCGGPKVADDIEEDPKLKKIPIVFLTATATRSRDQKGIYDGRLKNRPLLAKPIKLEALKQCVDDLLGHN